MKTAGGIFDAERDLNGLPTAGRLAGRQRIVAPLVVGLEAWMRAERGKLSRHSDVARAMEGQKHEAHGDGVKAVGRLQRG